MTKNEKYWQVRTAQRMWEHMQSAEETADQVAKVYAKARSTCESADPGSKE